MSSIDEALALAYRHAVEYLANLDQRPVNATTALTDLRQRLDVPLTGSGVSASRVVDDLVAATEGGHLGSSGGRFFAWVSGGALPSALAADWLVSTWDNNAAICASGPASAVVEEVAGRWILDLLGLPAGSSYAFTTGCQMAHLTCLAAARHALLAGRGWNVEEQGLSGAPRIRVLANEHHHGSVTRALRFLGIGAQNVEPLPTDSESRIVPLALAAALQRSDAPTIVILDAADLNVGAFDAFCEVIPIAKAARAWVHVDGAFGLWARASAEHRDRLRGVEQADSWAADAHKWLNTPKDIGIAIVADSKAHRAATAINASYLSSCADGRDEIDWTPEWTRRSRGFPVYAALRELGRDGLRHLIDRCCSYAARLTNELAALPGAELIAPATLNQGLVRFLDRRPHATAADHDARTDSVIEAINQEGTAFFSGTRWKGQRVMRISVVNARTTTDDLERTVTAVESVLATKVNP